MGDLRLVIVTGLSGAGKSQALKCLEDLGWFCVDNLPPALLPKLAELGEGGGQRPGRIALGIDLRGGDFFGGTLEALQELDAQSHSYQILFLEASDETLVRRFKETRRRHPLAPEGSVLDAIRREREELQAVRGKATHIVDTSDLTPQQLRKEVERLSGIAKDDTGVLVHVVSFGFKNGLPVDADLVFDVRFLPNPHYVKDLQPRTGLDADVRDYVLGWPVTQKFLQQLHGFLDFLMPQFSSEGKTQVVIAVGCTGGQHRSVAVGEWVAMHLQTVGYNVSVRHRDAAAAAAAAAADQAGGREDRA